MCPPLRAPARACERAFGVFFLVFFVRVVALLLRAMRVSLQRARYKVVVEHVQDDVRFGAVFEDAAQHEPSERVGDGA